VLHAFRSGRFFHAQIPDQEINMLVTLSAGIPVAITALGAALATLLGVIL